MTVLPGKCIIMHHGRPRACSRAGRLRVRWGRARSAARDAPVVRGDVPRCEGFRGHAARGEPPAPGVAPDRGDGARADRAGPVADAADLVFSSLPNGTSAAIVPALLDAGLRVVDLAGDFRLRRRRLSRVVRLRASRARAPRQGRLRPAGAVRRSGGRRGARREPRLLSDADDPRARAAAHRGTRRAGPGPCRRQDRPVRRGQGGERVDDRSPRPRTRVRPYRVPRHQHTPEMERGIELGIGHAVPVLFVPHLVPTVRGVVDHRATRRSRPA